jgi:hypothetical protein
MSEPDEFYSTDGSAEMMNTPASRCWGSPLSLLHVSDGSRKSVLRTVYSALNKAALPEREIFAMPSKHQPPSMSNLRDKELGNPVRGPAYASLT